MPRNYCAGCRYFVGEAGDLEREVPGLNILSSAFGSVRADTGLCRRDDFFCVANHGCQHWREREVASSAKPERQPPV